MDMENKNEEAMLMVCPSDYMYINSLSIPCAPLYLNID
jgi:hypothetical protein